MRQLILSLFFVIPVHWFIEGECLRGQTPITIERNDSVEMRLWILDNRPDVCLPTDWGWWFLYNIEEQTLSFS